MSIFAVSGLYRGEDAALVWEDGKFDGIPGEAVSDVEAALARISGLQDTVAATPTGPFYAPETPQAALITMLAFIDAPVTTGEVPPIPFGVDELTVPASGNIVEEKKMLDEAETKARANAWTYDLKRREWISPYIREGVSVAGYWRNLMSDWGENIVEGDYAPAKPPEAGPWQKTKDEFVGSHSPEIDAMVERWRGDNVSEAEKEKVSQIFAAEREKEKTWRSSMERALALGWINYDEAKKRGYWPHGDQSPDEYVEGRGWQPLPPVLFHVTTAKSAVEATGLKTRAELHVDSGAGLGAGSDESVSFATDPDVAQAIERGIREARSVLRGEITLQQLIDNAETGADAEHPYAREAYYYWNSTELPQPLAWLLHHRRLDQGYGITPRTMAEWSTELGIPEDKLEPYGHPLKGGDGQTRYTGVVRPITDDEYQSNLWDVYRTLAGYRERAGGPLDPLFMSVDIKALANTPEDQIATLRFRAREKSQGWPMGALSEWRTSTGDAVVLDHPDEGPPPLPEQNPFHEAFHDLIGNRTYRDSAGDYHYRRSGDKPGGPKTPWSDAVRAEFPDHMDFYRAAQDYIRPLIVRGGPPKQVSQFETKIYDKWDPIEHPRWPEHAPGGLGGQFMEKPDVLDNPIDRMQFGEGTLDDLLSVLRGKWRPTDEREAREWGHVIYEEVEKDRGLRAARTREHNMVDEVYRADNAYRYALNNLNEDEGLIRDYENHPQDYEPNEVELVDEARARIDAVRAEALDKQYKLSQVVNRWEEARDRMNHTHQNALLRVMEQIHPGWKESKRKIKIGGGQRDPLFDAEAFTAPPRLEPDVRSAIKKLEAVSRFLPPSWIDAMNRRGKIGVITNGRRAYHKEVRTGPEGQEINSIIRMPPDAGEATALHEIGHRVQDVFPWTHEIEREFWRRRTAGSEQTQLYDPPDPEQGKEFTRKDAFFSPYVGKIYFDDFQSQLFGQEDPREVISMGLEHLWYGGPLTTWINATGYELYGEHEKSVWESDREHAELMLGLLASRPA